MQIEAIGLEDIQETLEDLEEKTQNTLPLMMELKNHLYNVISESFEKEESPDGRKWTPIKENTLKNSYGKGKKKYTKKGSQTKAFTRFSGKRKILFDTGHMRKSLYYDAKKWNLTVGVNATAGKDKYQYPLVHQFGTDKAGRNKNVKIEARPFMPIKSNDELYEKTKKELDELIEDWFEQMGKK